MLLQVITWATYHKDDPPPPEDDENKEKRTDDISSWDADFLKVDQGTLFELILAANYLDIKVNDGALFFIYWKITKFLAKKYNTAYSFLLLGRYWQCM